MKQTYLSVLLLLFCSILQAQKDTSIQIIEKDSFTIVDTSPGFPDGEAALMKFIKKNQHYPKSAKTNKIAGTVYVSFIVEPNGSLTNIVILKGLGYGCDEEAMRLVSIMPQWIPATVNNKPVRSRFRIPIRFGKAHYY